MRNIRSSRNQKIQVSAQNFGPIKSAEIDLRPLTVFVGESNSGKTYLSALIYAMHRAFDGFPQFPWSISTHYQLHYFLIQNYFYRINEAETESEKEDIRNTLEKLNNIDQPFTFSDLPQRIYTDLISDFKDSSFLIEELKRCFDHESISNLRRNTGNKSSRLSVSIKVDDGKKNLWNFSLNCSGTKKPVVEGIINPDLVILSSGKKKLQKTLGLEELNEYLHSSFFKQRRKSYYLPAARSGIMQSHGVIASSLVERSSRIGIELFPEISTFSGMIVDFLKFIIHYKEQNKRSRSDNKIRQIADKLEEEVLGGKIQVNRTAPSAYPEFLYHPNKTNKNFQMNQSSSMVSELTPLVLFLRGIVKRGDTLIIEEPESHLHPGAQTQVAITLAKLVRAGVRVIITTHSEWFLEQISNLVRIGEMKKRGENQTESESWLTADEVGTWWFHSDKPVEEIIFDPINGFEPMDYGEVAEGLYNQSVDLRTLLMEKTGDKHE